MSKIDNLDILSDKYKESTYKEGEIRRFKEVFGANIVRDDYTSERELEADWNSYLSLPYGLKVLANERCLRLYGKKNEEQYMEQRKKFLNQDISLAGHDVVYRPSGFTESSFDNEEEKHKFMNSLAKRYMDGGGHSLLLIDYDNLRDLNKAYYDFNNQCDDHKNSANNKSLEIYGYEVPEIYKHELHRFLQKDIKDKEYNDPLKPIVVDSLSATEAVFDVVYHSDDFLEKAILTTTAIREASTPVESSIADEMKDIVEKEMLDEDYLGRYNYLLPWEIMNIQDKYLLESNPLFVNYYARALGLRPVIRDFQEQMRLKLSNKTTTKEEMISIGWNPVLEFNEANHKIASTRANNIIKEHCHYQFIDLSNSPNMLTEADSENSEFKQGISVLILKEMEFDETNKESRYIPKVFVTLDYTTPYWNELKAGIITTKRNIDEVIENDYKTPLVTCFFIELTPEEYTKLASSNFEDFNNSNELQDVCRMLKTADMPSIANKKLFMMTLINMILYNSTDPCAIRFNNHIDYSKDVIHVLYDQLDGKYKDILDAYSKLGVYDKLEDLQESVLFEHCNFVALIESEIHMKDLVPIKNDWDDWQGFVELFNEKMVELI